MGDGSRNRRADAFVQEFGEDLERISKKDRGHDVTLSYDDNYQVRLFINVGDFDYMSPTVLFDPDSDFLEDLSDILGLLGLEETAENREAVRARLQKADLL